MGNIKTVKLRQPGRDQNFIARASFAQEPVQVNRAVVTNLLVTQQELDNLFSTKKYTRPYQPEYYNPLEDIIGELWSEAVRIIAISAVVDKVRRFIPYLVIDQTNTSFDYEKHILSMNLVFFYEYDFDKTLYNYERQFDTVT